MKHLTRAIVVLGLFLTAATPYAAAANIEHVVQKGDTLYHISRLYGVPVDVLLQVNDIANARSLKVGTKIEIPETYVVKTGDTLYSIARDQGIPLDELAAINHVGRNYIIKVGERLILPASAPGKPTVIVDPSGGGNQSGSEAGAGSGADSSSSQAVSISTDSSPLWPASGRRVFLSGKLAGGTQIAGTVGDPLYAVAGGRVVWVGPYRGYGRVVFVESPAGYIYVYGGAETTLVKVGDTVSPGTQVANMGINPHLGKACAYFFVYKNGKPVNPRTAPRG